MSFVSRELHHCGTFQVSTNTRLWVKYLDVDPILSPLSDRLVSRALEINEEDVPSFFYAGIISKTCCIPISEEKLLFLSNYWDLLQASAALSLIALNTPVEQAVKFGERFCDLLSVIYEDNQLSSRLDFAELTELAVSVLFQTRLDAGLALEKSGNVQAALKVSTDIFKAQANFQEYYGLACGPIAISFGEAQLYNSNFGGFTS